MPNRCLGAWRVTLVKKLDIFVLFAKQGIQRNIQIYSCGGRTWFLQGHHVHSISWNALGMTFNKMCCLTASRKTSLVVKMYTREPFLQDGVSLLQFNRRHLLTR